MRPAARRAAIRRAISKASALPTRWTSGTSSKACSAAVAAGDRAVAGASLEAIRKAVTVNLLLSLLTVGIASWGRFGG